MATKRYFATNIVHPKVKGYIVAWMSNQLTSPFPQWPQIRVEPEQKVVIGIDPFNAGFRCDSNPEGVQVTAIIEADDGSQELLPFAGFKYEGS
jgi:hypothetical protein